ncbi:MAG TPA: oligosaccharide flippase family protein [Candidatus Thermoplasmatota archaeon]|nr:oligosaccharide flippase family protein [Candidatus Thermoplasmatota archaeon]
MIARKAIVVFANTILGGILGYVALKVVALEMGPALMGQVLYAMGILYFIQLLTDLGFQPAHVKAVSSGEDVGDALATYWWAKLALSLVVTAGALAWIAFQTNVLSIPFVSTSIGVILAVLVHAFFQNLRQAYIVTFDGLQRTATTQTIIFAEHISRVPLAILAALLFAGAHGSGPLLGVAQSLPEGVVRWIADNGALLYAGSFVGGTFVSWALAAAYRERSLPRGRPQRRIVQDYWRFARPILAVSLVGAVSFSTDRLMLGFFWGDVDVGQYGAAIQVAVLLVSLAAGVALLVFPAVSAAISEGDWPRVTRLSAESVRYTSMALVLPIVFLAVFAPHVIRVVLSDAFLDGGPALVVLALTQLVVALGGIFLSIGLGLGRPGRVSAVNLFIFTSNIVLNLVLIPTSLFGLPLLGLKGLGAAYATFSANLVGMFLFAYVARDAVGTAWIRPIAKHVAAGALVGAGAWLALGSLAAGSLGALALAAIALAMLGAYLGLLALLREFGRAEAAMVVATLHPRALRSYVSGELESVRR